MAEALADGSSRRKAQRMLRGEWRSQVHMMMERTNMAKHLEKWSMPEEELRETTAEEVAACMSEEDVKEGGEGHGGAGCQQQEMEWGYYGTKRALGYGNRCEVAEGIRRVGRKNLHQDQIAY